MTIPLVQTVAQVAQLAQKREFTSQPVVDGGEISDRIDPIAVVIRSLVRKHLKSAAALVKSPAALLRSFAALMPDANIFVVDTSPMICYR